MYRTPIALANWKMAMTIADSLAFVRDFQALAGDSPDAVEILLCAPYTGLWALANTLEKDSAPFAGQDAAPPSPASSAPAHRTRPIRPVASAAAAQEATGGGVTPRPARIPIQLGAQDMAAASDPARTGQVSAALLVDAGCSWVMLGHWEVRRHLGDDDATVNRKLSLALETGLRPALFVGEAHDEAAPPGQAVERQLSRVLAGCSAEQVATIAFVYEPEGAIGVNAPTSPEHVADVCTLIRSWLRCEWGEAAAGRLRIVYGGSVAPEFAPQLLACPDLDGLAATRHGRDAATFAQIVRLIAEARPQPPEGSL
jgi:triosephosphate isomerase